MAHTKNNWKYCKKNFVSNWDEVLFDHCFTFDGVIELDNS